MRESRRIFRFAVIGTLNALIIAAVIWLMMDELDIDYMLSNITAYVIAQTHNFIWCKHWIFPLDDKEKKSNTWRQVLLFSIGIGKATWLGFAGYMGVGLILWLYMILIKWKHEKVWMKTPDGDKEY